MPGETFQTLKEKSTQQAKQSGMSQSAAENYGSVMATNAAVQGGATGQSDFLGSDQKQRFETQDEIFSNIVTQPSEVIAERKKAAQDMKDKGGVYNIQTGEVEYPKKTKLFEGLDSFNIEDIPSLTLQAAIGAGKGIQALLDKIFKPSVEDFNDPVVLAAINRLFEEKGEKFKTDYMEKYADKMKEAFDPQLQFEEEQGFGSTGDATGIASLFDDKLAKAAADAKSGKLGKGVQRINFPEEFYTGSGARLSKGKIVPPQTIGELENLAGLDAQQYLQGENYNPKLAQMIFDARATLNQNKSNQGGGGAGIPSLPGVPPNLVQQPGDIIQDDAFGDVVLGYGPRDIPYTAVMPRSGYQYAYDAAGTRYEIPVGGQSGETYRGRPFTFREGEPNIPPQAIGDKFKTGIPSLAPTTIDYASIGPQYGGYVNQGISNPQLASYLQNLQMFPRKV